VAVNCWRDSTLNLAKHLSKWH